MSTLSKWLRSLIEQINFFNSPRYFRFNKRTTTSSPQSIVCSLIIWVGIILLLVAQLSEVISGRVVSATQGSVSSSEAEQTQIAADGINFMMGFESSPFRSSAQNSQTLSLFVTQTLFDDPSNSTTIMQIATEPCRSQHWQSIPNIESLYMSMNMNRWQCLPLQSRLRLRGTAMNRKEYTEIRILCSSCSAGQAIQATVHLMNPMVNLGSTENFLAPGIESGNFVVLQENVASYLILQPQSYTVYTSVSPLPWTSDHTLTGTIIDQPAQKTQIYNSNQLKPSATVIIQKSSQKLVFYRRTYNLLDAFALIGGAFLFIVGLLFILRWFGQSFSDMAAASIMYRDKKSKDYSIRYYIGQGIYKLLKPLGLGEKWPVTAHFQQIEEKMACLTDAVYLQQRIQSIEIALSLMFEKHQLKALYLASKPNIVQAYSHYQALQVRKSLIHYLKKKNSHADHRFVTQAEEFFKPNCSDPSNPYITPTKATDNRQSVSTDSQKCIKVELTIERQIKEEVQSQRIDNNLQMDDLFAEDQSQQPDREGRDSEQAEAIFEMTKEELELLKLEASRADDNSSLSRKIYQRLLKNDQPLLQALLGKDARQPHNLRFQTLTSKKSNTPDKKLQLA